MRKNQIGRISDKKSTIYGYLSCASEGALIFYNSGLHWKYPPTESIYGNLKSQLIGKEVKSIFHLKATSDLIIEFTDKMWLELFLHSSYYEGWQLEGEGNFSVIAMPGGSY
ncbi:hypothetical protein JQN58_17715 [Aneurinibacillus sp. BA2021]|nr:hypothetical protein [Aneurinibacillus sp. BA2021]